MKKTSHFLLCKTITLIFLAFCPCIAFPQLSDWTHYMSKDRIYDLLSDGDYLWIATDGGLVRLNKRTDEKKYYNRDKDGLPDNHLRALAKDKDGNLWVGSKYYGVGKFDGANWENYNESNSGIYSEQWCTALTVDKDNNKWIGSLLRLNKFDGRNWESWTTPNGGGAMSWFLYALTFDNDNTLWVGAEATGFYFGKFTGLEIEVYPQVNAPVRSIVVDKNNVKWLASQEGLIRFDGTNFTRFDEDNSEVPSNIVLDAKMDKEGNLWFSSDNFLVKYDGTNFTKYENTMIEQPIYSIELDEDGQTIWVGTYDKGLFKFKNGLFEVKDISNSPLPLDKISSIHIDARDNVWIGTYNGLSQLDKQGNWHSYFQKTNYGDPTLRIYAAQTDKEGNLWVSMGQSDTCVVKITPDRQVTAFTTKNSILQSGDAWAITGFLFDQNGNTWGGSYSGLYRYDGSKWERFTPANTPLVSYQTGSLTLDQSGNIWGSTAEKHSSETGVGKGCLFKYDGTEWTIFTTGNSGLPTNAVGALAIDSKNNLWINTLDESLAIGNNLGGGLTKFDGNSWTTYNKTNSGLQSNSITNIVVDKNDHLWLATYGGVGLTYYDRINWTTFNANNSGIGFNEVGAIAFDNYRGLVWLSYAYGGLSTARYDGIDDIGNLRQNGESLIIFQSPSTKEITLTYPENFMPERMEIYDTSGGLVYSGRLNGEERACTYPLATLNINQRGLYLIKVSDGKQSRTTKLSIGN